MVTYVKTGGPAIALGATGGATTMIPNHGVSFLNASSNEVYVLAPPELGITKRLISTSSSSVAGPTVRGSTGTTVTFGTAGETQLAFGAATVDQCVDLIGISSIRWAITNTYPSVSSAAGVTAAST